MIDPGATASDGSLAATVNVFPGQQLNSVMSGHKMGLAVPDHVVKRCWNGTDRTHTRNRL